MELTDVLDRFRPISLEEMDAVKLMNRIDSKFLARRDQLEPLLESMLALYDVQEIDCRRLCPYHTVYLDTESAAMYLAHHNGRKTRQKIRMREYEVNGKCFFEIKNKNNKGRTKKKRVGIDRLELSATPEVTALMEKHGRYPLADLRPTLENHFERITLVNKGRTERLTIDVNLRFHHLVTDRDADFSRGVVIELKQDGNIPSQARDLLRNLRIKPIRISKYCIGSVLTNPALKQNRFKKKLRKIDKLFNSIPE